MPKLSHPEDTVSDGTQRLTDHFQKAARVAIVHDWLPLYGGAERVLEQIINVFPDADLFSMVDFIPPHERGFLKNKPVNTSFVQRLPGVRRNYRRYLPVMPLAVEQFDLSGYDLIISSSYAVAKGVLTGPDQLHICYCHSPMRYAWDLQNQYLSATGVIKGPLQRWLASALLHYIRMWDVRTANGVNTFIANSAFIARRIRKVYGREANVIYPPVDLSAYEVYDGIRDDYYVTMSRMVPYKKIDLIVQAFNAMPERRLVVIGDGPEYEEIRRLAGPNVQLLGHLPHAQVLPLLQRARAFVFAAEEDFGIAPVEAQACGTPVIAFGKGGARETVIPGQTGVFFGRQTPDSLCSAVFEFEDCIEDFRPHDIRAHARRFSEERFRRELANFVTSAWKENQQILAPMRPSVNSNGHRFPVSVSPAALPDAAPV